MVRKKNWSRSRVLKRLVTGNKTIVLITLQVKKALADMGHTDILENINDQDIQDVISVMEPIELLGAKNKNSFQAAHYNDVSARTSHQEGDSDLKKALKDHVRGQLLPILKIQSVIKKCQDVALCIKGIGMNERLEGGTLKQDVDTRWMSVLMLLKSFFIWPDDENSVEPPSQAKIDQVVRVFLF